MRAGKVPPELLQRLVLSNTGARRPEVLVGPALGEDAAVLDLGGDLCVISVDPITGAAADAGRLAVHVACNDVAAHGAEPVGVLLTLLLPEGTEPEQLGQVMESAAAAARDLGVQILGGHTEVTPGITATIIAGTALGRAPRGRLITSSGLEAGDTVLLTKAAGLEGTAIFAADLARRLEGHVDPGVLERARAFGAELSIVPEAMVARDAGATSMHDVTEGGVLGALYEMATASGAGLEVWTDRIPIRPETRSICQALGADPLRLVGSGALLVGTADPARLECALAREGIAAAAIARVVAGDQLWQVGSTGRVPLEPPCSDQLWEVLAREDK